MTSYPLQSGVRSPSPGVARLAQRVIDIVGLAIAFCVAYALRFDGEIPRQSFNQCLLLCPWVVGLEYVSLRWFQMTRSSWRFVGLREARGIVRAALAASSVLVTFRLAVPWFTETWPRLQYLAIPLGVIAGNAMLMVLVIVGVRVVRRLNYEQRKKRNRLPAVRPMTPTLLIGAGSAGHTLVREIVLRPDLGILIVGFVDDDPAKRGALIDRFEVFGNVDELATIAEQTGATQALISISAVRGEQVRRITDACDACGLKAKIVPPINDLVDGQVKIAQIRDVRIEDLLGRDPVDMVKLESASFVRDKIVMVTGAGGSVGAELCRQILHAEPAGLILVEQAENSLYHIHRELLPIANDVELIPAIADICDAVRMRDLFLQYTPHVVFHAAAHKHVPMMEANPCEAIKNNALGTRVVADLASELGVEAFVFISTDKAVNPTSVMGATKRLAEVYLQSLQRSSRTRFVSVRFGNVLGSAGSVIPLFREQIAKGGPVTVTHPEMVRFFMTIPEACQLVLEAGAIGDGGDVLVLDMGRPIRILDIAEQMIRLSGLEPERDIEIAITGVRPGEKLYEELAFDHETMMPTRCPKIFLHQTNGDPMRSPEAIVRSIEAAIADAANVRARLRELLPCYQPLKLKSSGSVRRTSGAAPKDPMQRPPNRRQAQ